MNQTRGLHARRAIVSTLLAPCLLTALLGVAAPAAAQAPPAVLVLHDSGGPYGYLGAEYALMVRNLLGHFRATVTTRPVTSYASGQMRLYNATVYIGSTYDEPSFYPPSASQVVAYNAFLKDAAAADRPLIWLNHNLWRLAWGWDPAWGAEGFNGRFGLNFVGLDDAGLYNRVLYKGTDLLKGVVPFANPGADLTGCTPEGSNTFACNTELNVVSIANAALASTYAEAYSTFTNARNPYVTKGGNLWFVGDIPFSYHSEEDRYLAFADLLHDMLGASHPEQHRALARLEDISANTETSELNAVVDVFKTEAVPFGVATIARYRDPLGFYNDGVAQNQRLSGSAVAGILAPLAADGRACIVYHGYTHQGDDVANPYDRVSGDDFEFYRVRENADGSLTPVGPMPNDSASWARNRIQQGRTIFQQAGLVPFAWEAPHYMASATDYQAIRSLYPTHYGRLVYFATGSPAGRFLGQFYPYVIQADAYGYRVLPENLGYIDPAPFPGYRALLPADIIRSASKARVVRDGFASFYYHPYLGPSYLQETIQGIKALGYVFTAPCALQ